MKIRLPAWSILMIICVIIGAALAFVNELTAGPIAQQAIEAANAARRSGFPAADSFDEITLSADSGVDSCYAAMADGQLLGYVVQVTVSGFGGPMEITVGMDLEQNISGINVGGDDFSETPGLGAKAKDPDFTNQFTGLTIPTQLGSDGLDAITGATITSGAVSSGVNKGGYFILDLIDPPAEDNRPEDLQFGGVLPGATTKEQQTAPEGVDELYTSDAGVVVYITGKGRNGDVQVQVGIGHSGQVAGVYIDPAKHQETEGMGDLIEESYFWGQFIGNTGSFAIGDNIDAVSGATISSETVVACVNQALAAALPYLDPSKATDIPQMGESAAPIQTDSGVKKQTQVVKTGSGVTVMSAADWSETYPEIYASYLANSENDEVLDHVEEYPMISVVYEGMAFNKYYGTARGHTYTVEDVTSTGRPHALANCFSCKTPDFTAMVNEMGETAYTLPFDDVLAEVNESISCYNCHANTGNELVITHTYLADALGEELTDVEAATLSCAQCHVEYYFHPTTKATSLPYTSLATMSPDAILEYYNDTMVNGEPFADYTNPRSGVRQIKVQHPEFETFMGEGSDHADDFTCADCHMGDAISADGTPYTSHYWMSPLDNQALLEGTCAQCHENLIKQVSDIQAEAERRTYAIGYELEALTEKLVLAVESGLYTEEELNAIRAVARDAQFYWDFVFVENSEGAHNSQLTKQCLDKAETLLNQAMGLFTSQEG